MKKNIIIAAILSMFLVSCEGILDTSPRDMISDGNMWSNTSLSKAGMDALMYPLMWNVDGINDLIPSDGRGGINRVGMEGMGYTSILDGGIPFLKDATKEADNRENSAEWRCMYTVIHACNKAIAHLSSSILGEALYNEYVCEARMIRAFCYSRLVMVFGEVPIYLEETDNVNCTKTQNTWDEVWKMIIDECTDCLGNAHFQTNNLGGPRMCKPSKGMAYALRGNAYMWLAANMNPKIYEGHAGISTSEIKNYYTLAAADFANVKASGFGLWDGVWEDMYSYKNEHNKEMIFPLEYSFSLGFSSIFQWVIGSRSNIDACWNRLTASAQFVDDFEWADGSKFDWAQVFPDWNNLQPGEREVFFCRDSLDTFAAEFEALGSNASEKAITLSGQRTKVISRVGQAKWDQYYLDHGNEARLRTAYDTRDPRLNKAVVTPYKKYKMHNEFLVNPIDFQMRWPRFKRQDDVDDSDLWMEFSSNMVYAWYKYLITDGITVNRRVDGTDWPLLRYTQIQLMWAEALVGSDDVEGAKTLLNEIRSRAGMPAFTSTDPAKVLEEIRYESRIELCLEGKDFFNEIRWGTFKDKKFDGADTTSPQSCWRQGGWKTGYYYRDGMWPLSAPLKEIVKNPNLKKRPKDWLY